MNNEKTYRFIISGGGTGGHVFPALAVAHELKEEFGSSEILFVGAQGKIEMTKVPENGFKIIGLNIRGIQRKFTLANLKFPFLLIGSLLKARKIIKEFQPNIAIGFGGYASAPILWMASAMGVPTVIQEQNSFAGIANRFLGRRARKICVAFDEMEKYFPADKIVLTGNPVRQELKNTESLKSEAAGYFNLDPNKKTLLVLGGSLGARTINESIVKDLQELTSSGFQVIWQTGQLYFDEMTDRTKEMQKENVRIHKFLDRMDLAYSIADVVISRAGALSIAELCLTGKASILVPSPNVAENHQARNAAYLTVKDAALMIPDPEAKEKLVKTALELLMNSDRQIELQKKAKEMAFPDAVKDIVKQIKELLG